MATCLPMEGDLSDLSAKEIEAYSTRGPGPGGHTVSILGVTYIVKEYQGDWWKGCCFRRQTERAVLRNVSLYLQSGEVTAVLGSSGEKVLFQLQSNLEFLFQYSPRKG